MTARATRAWWIAAWLAMAGGLLLAPVAYGQPITRKPVATQPAAKTRPAGGSDVGVTRIALATGIVLVAIFLLRWWGKGYFVGPGASRGPRALQVISRANIAPKQQLMVVQIGRRLVLVANCGAQMNALCEISDPDEVAEVVGQATSERSDSVAKAFGGLFRREEQKFEAAQREERMVPIADNGEMEVEAAAIQGTRQELTGLMEKVKLLSRQFRRST